MTTETTTDTRISGHHQALARYEELLTEQPAALSPQVREALAWARLEDESTPLAWEGARKLATTPEPGPVEHDLDELPEYRPERDRLAVRIARRGSRDYRISVPTRWALEYERGQEFVRERLNDGTLIFRPVEVADVVPLPPERKLRRPRGANMTIEQVHEVRARLAAGQMRQGIMDDMGLTEKQVGGIARGKTWKNA